jgi:hypothetical protein
VGLYKNCKPTQAGPSDDRAAMLSFESILNLANGDEI